MNKKSIEIKKFEQELAVDKLYTNTTWYFLTLNVIPSIDCWLSPKRIRLLDLDILKYNVVFDQDLLFVLNKNLSGS